MIRVYWHECGEPIKVYIRDRVELDKAICPRCGEQIWSNAVRTGKLSHSAPSLPSETHRDILSG